VTEEILRGVYHCKQDLAPYWPGEWTAINVIVGERIAIVDTGIPGGEALVWRVLDSLGRSPSDVVAIVNSHFHGDHTGSNGALRSRTNARIMIHALDAPRLGSGEIEGPSAGPADVFLEDGASIDLGDRELRIVHLPGHTPGSIGVYLADEKALFTGDSLQARGTAVQLIASYADPEAYVASVRRTLELDIDHLVPAHAFVPFADSHLHGPDVRRFLDVSVAHARELDELIASFAGSNGATVGAAGVAARVCARYGFDMTSPMAIATVEAHLRQREMQRRRASLGAESARPWLGVRLHTPDCRWANPSLRRRAARLARPASVRAHPRTAAR
jgi:glyoxylase-like metal-dependent hydrolase (beta-lactamase superfamily II)